MNTKFGDTISAIRANAHWQIRLRPEVHNEQLLSLTECRKFVERNAVKIRGWDYPFLDESEEGRETGLDYFGSAIDWGRFKEFWRLFQSGQFYHLRALPENDTSNYPLSLGHGQPSGPVFKGVSLESSVFHLTEVMHFAKRLAATPNFGPTLHAEIILKNVKDRALGVDVRRVPGFFSQIGIADVPWSKAIPVSDLLNQPNEIAVEAAGYILERFGAHRLTLDVIRRVQQELLQQSF